MLMAIVSQMLCLNMEMPCRKDEKLETPHIWTLTRRFPILVIHQLGLDTSTSTFTPRMADTKDHGETAIRFKKRRKITHQRLRKCDDSDDEIHQNVVHNQPPASVSSLEGPESSIASQSEHTIPATMSVSEILRKRQAEQAQRKLKSVAQASSRDQSQRPDTPAAEQEAEMTTVDIAKSRFVPETGKIFTNDKQM